MKKLLGMILFAALALPVFAQQTMPLGPYGKIPMVTGNTAVDTATLTPGQMSSLLTGTPTAAANYTTPTATLLCRLMPFVFIGGQNNNFWWDWYVKNTSGGANAITVVAGSGVTVVGTATIAQNAIKHFAVVLTNCTTNNSGPAAQVISLGTSTF